MVDTMQNLVNEVRSMVGGTLSDEMNTLAEPYVAGSGELVLTYSRRSVQFGSVLCVGLNTFYVLEADSTNQRLKVIPSYDGGPDLDADAGALVRSKPVVSDWAAFREINGEIVAMSAPSNGLYSFGQYVMTPNWTSGTYPLPTEWTMEPIKLLMARYKERGYDSWQRVRGAQYQAEQHTVRIVGLQPDATLIEFTMAFPFKQATSLTDTLDSLGLSEFTRDIPALGAAANLLRSIEARRNQIRAQGDTRRPQEVPAGANLGTSRDYSRVQQQRIGDENLRLLKMFGYWNEPGTL